jgi:hypothetical protein
VTISKRKGERQGIGKEKKKKERQGEVKYKLSRKVRPRTSHEGPEWE